MGYSDPQRRAGVRSLRNSALTKKLPDEFCLVFYRHDLCAWAIHPIYFFWHQAIFQDGHLKNLWATLLMNRWLDCIQIWYGCSLGISDDGGGWVSPPRGPPWATS